MDENLSQDAAILSQQDNYKFRLEVFEGPLDLLLYLIKKNELDINDIPVEQVTRQYLEHLEAMEQLNMDVASEFIAMAAHLLLIKSRMLLPLELQEGEEEGFEDPRLELVQKLLEYKQFKGAAEELGHFQNRQGSTYERGLDATWAGETPENTIGNLNVFDLCEAFKEALKKARSAPINEIFPDTVTVQEKIVMIRETLQKEAKLSFENLLGQDPPKNEIICLFLAILEMVKLQEIQILQEGGVFGSLTLSRMPESTL